MRGMLCRWKQRHEDGELILARILVVVMEME